MAPPQLEPPSSLMAVLRGGGGGVEGGCAGQSCAEHFTGPKQRACLAPTPLNQGRAILVCWFTFSLPCFALPVSSFWYFSCSFLSVDFFLWFCLLLLSPPPTVLLHCQTSLAFHFPLLFRIYILTVITYLMTRLVWFSLIRVQEQTAKDFHFIWSHQMSGNGFQRIVWAQ